MAAYLIGDDENDKQSAIDKVMRDKASPDWYGDGIEGRYGGGLDPEIQGMYEFITEYGPLAGAAGATAVGLRALKSKAPRLMKWFSNFIKKGGTPKEAKLAEKLQKEVMLNRGQFAKMPKTDLQKWNLKVREIEKGWAKEKGVKIPREGDFDLDKAMAINKMRGSGEISPSVKKQMSDYSEGLKKLKLSPFDQREISQLSPYLSVKGAAKAGSSRQAMQDFMGEALRKKPLKVKGEAEQINKWIDKNFPRAQNKGNIYSPKHIEKLEMELNKWHSRPFDPMMEYYKRPMRGTPIRPSEGGKSIRRRLGEGVGILGIGSLVNYLADERMRAAEERARQERGNIDPYPIPYKIDDVESRPNRERLLDRGSIKPAPAPRVNPLKYLIEEEGGFLE